MATEYRKNYISVNTSKSLVQRKSTKMYNNSIEDKEFIFTKKKVESKLADIINITRKLEKRENKFIRTSENVKQIKIIAKKKIKSTENEIIILNKKLEEKYNEFLMQTIETSDDTDINVIVSKLNILKEGLEERLLEIDSKEREYYERNKCLESMLLLLNDSEFHIYKKLEKNIKGFEYKKESNYSLKIIPKLNLHNLSSMERKIKKSMSTTLNLLELSPENKLYHNSNSNEKPSSKFVKNSKSRLNKSDSRKSDKKEIYFKPRIFTNTSIDSKKRMELHRRDSKGNKIIKSLTRNNGEIYNKSFNFN